MRRRTIAIDCDDVIVATAPAILKYYNEQYGSKLELRDLYSPDLTKWAADDKETAVERVESFLKTPEYQNMKPFQEAIEVIVQLARYHTLHIVTGRADFLAVATEQMLETHFPGIFASIEYTNFFGQTPRSKAGVCQDLGADLLIDDHLHHATVVAECGVEVYLFGEYPWNETDTLPAGITRVRDWHEVARKLL